MLFYYNLQIIIHFIVNNILKWVQRFNILLYYCCLVPYWQDALKKARESYLVKSYDKAVTEYQTAQKLAPKEIDLSVELAQSLYKAEKYEEAEKLYKTQINKKQSSISNSDIYRQLGDSRMHQQKYTEAIDSYKNSLRSNPL